jgi:hypothetical protein
MLLPALALAQSTMINGHLVIVGSENYCDTTGSSTNAYVCNLLETITQYNAGATYRFKANAANTGAATLALNGIASPVPIVKFVGGASVALAANDIRTGRFVEVIYDGTSMQVQSVLDNFPASIAANGANCTVAGTFPNGVDASGVSENCVALSLSLPKTATYPVVVGDFNSYATIPVASGTFTLTLPAAANQPSAGKYIKIINYGTGVVTIARVDTTINGGTTSLVLPAATALETTSAWIMSDGTNYIAGTDALTAASLTTLTNKRLTKRTGTTTSSATPTINTDTVDFYSLTAQTVDITSFTTNLSGTPTEGQTLWIAITGTAARAITWGASFEASTVALPTTTVTTARLDVGFVWNTVTSKWRCVAVS